MLNYQNKKVVFIRKLFYIALDSKSRERYSMLMEKDMESLFSGYQFFPPCIENQFNPGQNPRKLGYGYQQTYFIFYMER
jgi:hypothetical protein